eukprot:3090299-Rhodomonas_salina.2
MLRIDNKSVGKSEWNLALAGSTLMVHSFPIRGNMIERLACLGVNEIGDNTAPVSAPRARSVAPRTGTSCVSPRRHIPNVDPRPWNSLRLCAEEGCLSKLDATVDMQPAGDHRTSPLDSARVKQTQARCSE